MQYIDIGINLMNRQFHEDREEVLKTAVKTGVAQMILTGTSVRSSRQAADYAKTYPHVLYATAGVHPHDAKSCDVKTIADLKQLLKTPQVVAVGECGLDYDRDFSPREIQRKWFEAQLQLADDMEMPLFLHERAAFADFFSILKSYQHVCDRAVVHCFTGTQKELESYLDLGCYIGITGWVCDERRGEELRKIIKLIPSDRLMIETDAPFLIPRNIKPRPDSRRNEPKYLPHIAKEIAKCRGESLEFLAEKTTENAKKFFRLGSY